MSKISKIFENSSAKLSMLTKFKTDIENKMRVSLLILDESGQGGAKSAFVLEILKSSVDEKTLEFVKKGL